MLPLAIFLLPKNAFAFKIFSKGINRRKRGELELIRILVALSNRFWQPKKVFEYHGIGQKESLFMAIWGSLRGRSGRQLRRFPPTFATPMAWFLIWRFLARSLHCACGMVFDLVGKALAGNACQVFREQWTLDLVLAPCLAYHEILELFFQGAPNGFWFMAHRRLLSF